MLVVAINRSFLLSSKLRTKLKNFEKLRSSIKVDKRFPEKATEERQITILTPGIAKKSFLNQSSYSI